MRGQLFELGFDCPMRNYAFAPRVVEPSAIAGQNRTNGLAHQEQGKLL